MPFGGDDIDLSDILGTPDIAPSAAGWDALLATYTENIRSLWRFGLLGRAISVNVGTGGFQLLLCPPGYSALPLFLLLWSTGTAGSSNNEYACGVAAPGSSNGVFNWHTGFETSALTADESTPLLVWPYPGASQGGVGNSIFHAIGSPNIPEDIPAMNGDVAGKEAFHVDRTGSTSRTWDWWAYGVAWQNE